jgi:hypothetical protein
MGTAIAAAAMSATVLVSVAACGSAAKSAASAGGSAAAAPATPAAAAAAAANSCGVITQAEAGAALGQPVKAPELGKATVEGGIACVYYGPDVPAGTSPDIPVGGSVRVVLVTGPKALKYFDDYRTKVNAQPVAGLGDQAYYDGYASLSVLKGDAYVRIAVGIINNLKPEEKLAAAALPQL